MGGVQDQLDHGSRIVVRLGIVRRQQDASNCTASTTTGFEDSPPDCSGPIRKTRCLRGERGGSGRVDGPLSALERLTPL